MTTPIKVVLPDHDKLFQSIDDSFDVKSIKTYILVFGPDKANKNLGSKLRKHIIKKCKEDDFNVVLAEHDEIQKHYTKILGPIYDLCKMEYHLATEADKYHGYDLIDGIILIPDSAGSLIELGMFVIEEKIHSKMLILFNKEYKTKIKNNFVGKGAKRSYDNGHAITRIIDYKDFDNSWAEVSDFLTLIKSKKIWRKWKKHI
jgi:hypothetical protein